MSREQHIGESFDSFLKEQNIYEEVTGAAIKKVFALKLEQEMRKNKISKAAMARKMKTSRSALDRLLDPENTSVTLQTLIKAANAINKELVFALQ